MAKQPHCHSIALCFNLIARFKIGHTPRKNRHVSAATSRFIAYLSQSRKYYYNRQSMKLQPLFSKNFSDFLRVFPFFQFAPYLVLSPARHTTDEAKNGTARPPRLSFYRTLSMHLQALRAGNPSFPPAHARLQRTRTAYPAHRP